MQPYQWANLVTGLVSAVIFLIVSRRTPDRISRIAMRVWAAAMFWAAAAGPLIALTDHDALVITVSMIVTPIGWCALSICAARRLVSG